MYSFSLVSDRVILIDRLPGLYHTTSRRVHVNVGLSSRKRGTFVLDTTHRHWLYSFHERWNTIPLYRTQCHYCRDIEGRVCATGNLWTVKKQFRLSIVLPTFYEPLETRDC